MIISSESTSNLEFNRILSLIAEKCSSDSGKQRLLSIQPQSSKEKLALLLKEVDEARQIVDSGDRIPVRYFKDIRLLLNQIEPAGSFLETKECQDIQEFLDISNAVALYFDKQPERFPALKNLADRIDPLPALFKTLVSTIDPAGAIFDNASPDLKRIRKDIDHTSKQVHLKLDRILRKQSEHLQDEYITLKEGRLVLPVREFSVKKIPGIVHAQSGTGKTQFVEPIEVVQLNNELNFLYQEEKREIVKILKRIADQFRNHANELLVNYEILVQMDVILAKALYSFDIDGCAPRISDDLQWQIKKGYHPLLLHKIARQAVPLTVELGHEIKTLVISGPNAGGKTVAMKTVGILQLLFQSGFHIPVAEGSRFPVCEQIFAVIGDEQSIENDLSTFSSHIKQINDVIDYSGYQALILIDEIASGTDPAEGSALAVAILEKLTKSGNVSVVTTHHGSLKTWAHDTENVANAAMHFDMQKLTPRFELSTGVPGSSYAFEISKRLGLSEEILKRAATMIGESHLKLEELISDLSDKKQRYDELANSLQDKQTELEGQIALYRTRADAYEKESKRLEKEALKKANEIVLNANKTIETVVREIREQQAGTQVIRSGKKRVNQLKNDIDSKLSASTEKKSRPSFKIKMGLKVRSMRFGITGDIVTIYKDRSEVELDNGKMKITVPFNDIIPVDQPIKKRKSVQITAQSSTVVNELDVRGYQAEEAVMEVQRYLDQAIHSEWKELRIIHGKGTGALRKRIHHFLNSEKRVSQFRLGGYGEGDSGVTIIEL